MKISFVDAELSSCDTHTKACIVEAADRLAENTPLEKISVGDICREASVSRRTFYNHFNDKADLMTWFGSNLFATKLVQVGVSLTWEDAFYRILRDLCEDMLALGFRNASSSLGAEFYSRFPKRLEEALLREFRRRKNLTITKTLKTQTTIFSSIIGQIAHLLIVDQVFPGKYKSTVAAGMDILLPEEQTCRAYASVMASYVPTELKEALLHPRL